MPAQLEQQNPSNHVVAVPTVYGQRTLIITIGQKLALQTIMLNVVYGF